MPKAAGLSSRLDKLTEHSGDVAEFLVDGQVMTIPKADLLQVLKDDLENRDTAHTRIIKNATASRGFGKMLLLRQMIEEE